MATVKNTKLSANASKVFSYELQPSTQKQSDLRKCKSVVSDLIEDNSSRQQSMTEVQQDQQLSGIGSQIGGLPVLFKVERVLGVHKCPLSNKQIVRDFIKKYNCEALDGQMDKSLKHQNEMLNSASAVGKLTSIDRYLKVRRYLEKRQKRIWMKKVSYTVRKDTADKRLRIKGRFIKKEDQNVIM